MQKLFFCYSAICCCCWCYYYYDFYWAKFTNLMIMICFIFILAVSGFRFWRVVVVWLFCMYDCMYCKWITERTRYDITNTMSRCLLPQNKQVAANTHTLADNHRATQTCKRCECNEIHSHKDIHTLWYKHHPNTKFTHTHIAPRTRLWLTYIHTRYTFPLVYIAHTHTYNDTRRAHKHIQSTSILHACTHFECIYTSFVSLQYTECVTSSSHVCVYVFIDSMLWMYYVLLPSIQHTCM